MNRAKIVGEEAAAAAGAPFVWDCRNDCIGWAGNVAERLLGRDVLATYRGRYTTETGSRRVMAREGWRDLGDVAAAFFAEIPPALAQSGDWALVVNDDGSDTIGVVCNHLVIARAPRGMAQVPRRRMLKAFRVE
jgi:hypothetical protein